MNPQDHAYALPAGYMLEEYRIEGMLGSGGFGITYLAHDTHLNKRVAVKEYLPNDFAVRYAEDSGAEVFGGGGQLPMGPGALSGGGAGVGGV